MRKLLLSAGLLTGTLLLLPASGVGQGKPNNKNVKQEVTTEADYTYLAKVKELPGKITTLDPTAKTTTLRYEYPTYEPIQPKGGQQNQANRAYQALMQQQQKLVRDYQQILSSRNPRQQQQRMAQYQRDMQQLQYKMVQFQQKNASQFKTVMHAKEFELDIEPNVKVSRLTLPLEYDDKGNVKEYTKEELKKMKDKELPGYTAKFEDVQPGQTVKFYLKAPPKTTKKKSSETKKDGEAKKDDEAKTDTEKKTDSEKKTDPDAKTDTPTTKAGTKSGTAGADDPPPRPTVRAIVIVSDPDPADTPAKGKRKKNNQ